MQWAIMTKFAKIIYRHFFFSKNTFRTLQDIQRSQVSNELIDLEDQTSSVNSLSSLIFFFKWPLADALNEIKAYIPVQPNRAPEENADRHFRSPFSMNIFHYPSPKPR